MREIRSDFVEVKSQFDVLKWMVSSVIALELVILGSFLSCVLNHASIR